MPNLQCPLLLPSSTPAPQLHAVPALINSMWADDACSVWCSGGGCRGVFSAEQRHTANYKLLQMEIIILLTQVVQTEMVKVQCFLFSLYGLEGIDYHFKKQLYLFVKRAEIC